MECFLIKGFLLRMAVVNGMGCYLKGLLLHKTVVNDLESLVVDDKKIMVQQEFCASQLSSAILLCSPWLLVCACQGQGCKGVHCF